METKTTEPQKTFKTSALKIFEGEDETRCYILHYRVGNRAPESKVFLLDGDIADAIERTKKHCELMEFKFCGCYPFIVDLDKEEREYFKRNGMTFR